MSHDTQTDDRTTPLNEIAARESASFGIAQEAGIMIARNIGSQTHEQNAPLETLVQINRKLSIPVKEYLYSEDANAVGMLPDELSAFVAMGQTAREGLYEGEITMPSHVPELQREDYKKFAESAILRGMLTHAEVAGYTEALDNVVPVTMLGSKDQDHKRVNSVQVVKFRDKRAMPHQVEIVRSFDHEARETALLIKAV